MKLAGSLVLVYGRDVPELAEGVKIMLGWCDAALTDNAKNQKVLYVGDFWRSKRAPPRGTWLEGCTWATFTFHFLRTVL